MEKFLGSFLLVQDCYAELRAYAEALNVPATVMDAMSQGRDTTTTVCEEEGGGEGGVDHRYTVRIKFLQGAKEDEEFSFSLDWPFIHRGPTGVQSSNTMRLEGDQLVGLHIFNDVTITSVRYFQDDHLILEVECNNKTFRSVYKRVY